MEKHKAKEKYMGEIFSIISYWVTLPLLLILYVTLLADIFPRLFLRIRYAVKDNLGRGLKKYVFPGGRGVLYEPHPSVRKYLNKYLLFVKDGYKYLKCCFDSGVTEISYKVVMLDNKDKAIEAISVTEDVKYIKSTANIRLHADTSYVAIVVSRVNGMANGKMFAYNRVLDLALYFFSVAITSIIAMFAAASMVQELVYASFGTFLDNKLGAEAFFLFGAVIGFVSLLIYFMGAVRKGIGVVLNEKR